MSKIKYCPCCVGSGQPKQHSEYEFYVICGVCFLSTRYFPTQELAEEAWNERPNSTKLQDYMEGFLDCKNSLLGILEDIAPDADTIPL